MPKFQIRAKQQTLVEGQLISPADVLAEVEVTSDLPVDVILNLLAYRNAVLVNPDTVPESIEDEEPEEPEAEDSDEIDEDPEDAEPDDEGESSGNPFAESGEFTDAQLTSLEAAGVVSIETAQAFLDANNNTFAGLDDIGRRTDEKLRAIVGRN